MKKSYNVLLFAFELPFTITIYMFTTLRHLAIFRASQLQLFLSCTREKGFFA